MTICMSVSQTPDRLRQLQNNDVSVATNIHIILKGKMPSIAQAEQGATKKLHLKKIVKVNQLASCYESRHGYLAIGG